jgi:hypothetical protein
MIAVLLAAPAPADVRARAREIMKADYQRELPSEGETRSGTGAGRGSKSDLPPATPRRRGDIATGERGMRRFGALGSIAQMLLWVLMALVVVLCIVWLGRELGNYDGESKPAEADDGAPDRQAPDRRVIDRPLGDAEELARRGLFGEAIHVLLLRTLQELARRLPERLPRSLTSREILARVRIPDDARSALAGLVGAVEVSHFGNLEPGEADFQHCRQHFQRFAAAYLRGAA